MKRVLAALKPYIGGPNVVALVFVAIATALTALTAQQVFHNCSDNSDYLGLSPFFFAFGASAFAGFVCVVTGLIGAARKQWKQFAGAVCGGLVCVFLGFIVPYLSYQLSNCPPASPGGPMFSQSRPFQKCLGKHGGYEVDFVSPDIADYEKLVRGMVVARPPRSVVEEFSPRFVATVMLFRDEKAAYEYAKNAGLDAKEPERIDKAWFIVRYGAEALGQKEKEDGEAPFHFANPTGDERRVVSQCVSAIPTWFLHPRDGSDTPK